MCVCEKHRSAPAIIYGGCAGCEIESLRAQNDSLKAAGRKAADDATSALDLLSRVRFALGDNGTRMQGELVDYCRELAALPGRVAELEAQTPSALKAKLESAEARIQELEKWREDAALGLGASRVEALREAREVLRLCAVKPAYPKDTPEYNPVRALCERHGYGAVMACASSQWMESLERQGYPMDGAHVSGPCVGTVTSTINLITRALGE